MSFTFMLFNTAMHQSSACPFPCVGVRCSESFQCEPAGAVPSRGRGTEEGLHFNASPGTTFRVVSVCVCVRVVDFMQ